MGCDIHSVAQVFKDGKWTTKQQRPADDDRCYDTFAVMANVRNGYGFAGVSTGEGWTPISEPRGVPEGFAISNEEHEGQWMGDHSFSWLLLSELEDYFENRVPRVYRKHICVDRETWEKLESGELKNPKQWCAAKSGPDVKVVEPFEARSGEPFTDVAMTWDFPATDRLWLLKNYIEALRKLASDEGMGPGHVRLVFGFDN